MLMKNVIIDDTGSHLGSNQGAIVDTPVDVETNIDSEHKDSVEDPNVTKHKDDTVSELEESDLSAQNQQYSCAY